MDPKELGGFLSEFRGRLSAPIFSHDGTVDKFIGDAIMAVFGAPLSHADDARRALNCARDMLYAAGRWSQEREKAGLPPVSIGIGGHYGEVFAGALGDEHLLEYTVIGDTVSVAERLERLTREFGSPLVVSARLLAAAGERIVDDRWVRLAAQTLSGHRAQIESFAMRNSHSGSRVLPLP
jgi:adenylate cyclase